jgi:hypothetical protein
VRLAYNSAVVLATPERQLRGRRKYTGNTRIPLLALSAFFLISASFGQSPRLTPFEAIDFTQTRLTRKAIQALIDHDRETFSTDFVTDLDLPLLRGLIFGRRGRIFKESSIQEYLQGRKWYKPDPAFDNRVLTPIERENIDLVRLAEAETHGDDVLPGDLRLWQNKKIPYQKAGFYSLNKTRIMRAEIEALHGKTFESEPLLQRYFAERYWYKPNPNYNVKVLNSFERANLQTLWKYEDKNERALAPYTLIRYDNRPIKEADLRALSLYELRLIRNGFYAMRGRKFTTPWLKEYFENIEWYEPAADQSKVILTRIDDQNLAKVLRVERRKRDELSTQILNHQELAGLFVEDLRKLAGELPARHGKVFADKSLQAYFGAQPWYKPNPDYRQSQLSKVEQKNLATIESALKRTKTQFLFEEG